MEDKSKKVKSYHLLDVEVTTEPNDEIKDHLRPMVQGTPGGFRFRATSFDTKLKNLGESYFLTLKKSGRLLGTVCLVHKSLYQGDSLVSGWYLRYFHIKAPIRSTVEKKRKQERKSSSAGRILLRSVDQYLKNPETLLPEERRSDKCLMFGFIIEDNVRSAKWGNDLGILPYGKLQLFIFTRFNPGDDARVSKIKVEEIEGMKLKLKEYYSNYSLYSDQNIFFENNYYVIREGGEIVAGLQANPEEWEIFDKPGISGFLVKKILPRVPFLAKRINLKAFRFAAIEGIYCKTGYEPLLSTLLETVCARHNVYFAFCYTDQHSPVMSTLKKHVNKGLISKMIHTDPVDIRIKFVNWDKEEEKRYSTGPFYVSCFDST